MSDALQAQILGDLERTRTLYSEATAADGTDAELAYRHARILEDLDLADAAIQEYCRALALGAPEVGILDARDRLDALYEVVRERLSERALEAFVSGLDQADLGLYDQAAASFAVAIDENPAWPAPVYNRALVLEQLGRLPESIAEYQRYLELTPSEVDPVVADVARRIGELGGELTRPTPSPGNALALGVVFPGMGQYYTGRNRQGTIVLGAAAAIVVAGFAYKEVTVVCTVTPVDGECPGPVHDEITERPYLGPALIVTGVVMVAAAVEAYIRARNQRAAQAEAAQELGGGTPTAEARFRVVGPSISGSGTQVDLNLIGVRFR